MHGDTLLAMILSRLYEMNSEEQHFPKPFGVFYLRNRDTYEQVMNEQITAATTKLGNGNLDKLLMGRETWVVQ